MFTPDLVIFFLCIQKFSLHVMIMIVVKIIIVMIIIIFDNNVKLYRQLSQNNSKWIENENKSCFMYKNVY